MDALSMRQSCVQEVFRFNSFIAKACFLRLPKSVNTGAESQAKPFIDPHVMHLAGWRSAAK